MPIVDIDAYREPEPDVWQCRCGSFTFWLYSDGPAYCSECKSESVSMNGYWTIPDRPKLPESKASVHPLFRVRQV